MIQSLPKMYLLLLGISVTIDEMKNYLPYIVAYAQMPQIRKIEKLFQCIQ